MLYHLYEFEAIYERIWLVGWQSAGEKIVHNAMPGASHGFRLAYSTSNDLPQSIRANLKPNRGEK